MSNSSRYTFSVRGLFPVAVSESHPVSTFQDLERSICVPLCTIPLPGTTGIPHQRTAECGSDDTSCTRNHAREGATDGNGGPKVRIPGSKITVNTHTMLSTPIVTPEGSPARAAFDAFPSSDEPGGEDHPAGRTGSCSPRETVGEVQHAHHATVSHLHGQRPYGTRLTTIILVRWTGEVTYVERDVWWMDEMGCVHKGGTEERRYRFSL